MPLFHLQSARYKQPREGVGFNTGPLLYLYLFTFTHLARSRAFVPVRSSFSISAPPNDYNQTYKYYCCI